MYQGLLHSHDFYDQNFKFMYFLPLTTKTLISIKMKTNNDVIGFIGL